MRYYFFIIVEQRLNNIRFLALNIPTPWSRINYAFFNEMKRKCMLSKLPTDYVLHLKCLFCALRKHSILPMNILERTFYHPRKHTHML